ncbi:MAG: pentapeptide repeat-containing protein [Enterobacteriaceae bacterium]
MLPVTPKRSLQPAAPEDAAGEATPCPFQAIEPRLRDLRDLLHREEAWYREQQTDEPTIFASVVREILAHAILGDAGVNVTAGDKTLSFHQERAVRGKGLRVHYGDKEILLPLSWHELSALLQIDRVKNPINYAVSQSESRDWLVNCDLSNLNLTHANLAGINLTGVNLSGSTLRLADLSGSNLSGANLTGAELAKANLAGACLEGALLSNRMGGTNLSGVNLSGLNLQGVELWDANLSGANLTGSDLSGASLAHADFRGAQLAGAKLVRACMLKANLCNADLTEADLTAANLAEANLTGVRIKGTLLPKEMRGITLIAVNLSGLNLADVNLREAKLTGANLTDTNLAGADLMEAHISGAQMAGANLTHARLQGAALIGVDLSEVELSGANLRGANLTGTRLKERHLTENMDIANLYAVNLSGLNLQGYDFHDKNMRGVNFSGSDLQKANLTRANCSQGHLLRADLTGANLRGTDLSDADLSQANLSEVLLQQADLSRALLADTMITLQLPVLWSDQDLDICLNHRDNHRSLLTSIDSIDACYLQLKLALMTQLITSLDRMKHPKRLQLFSDNFFLLMKPPYCAADPAIRNTSTEQIEDFLQQHIVPILIEQGNTRVWLSTEWNALLFLLHFVGQQSDIAKFAIDNNGFFIQLIVNSLASAEDALQQQAKALYTTYLASSRIEPYTRPEQHLFGDVNAHVDWSDNQLSHIILVEGNHTLLLSEAQFNQMRRGDSDTHWSGYFCYHHHRNGCCGEAAAPIPDSDLKHFPFLQAVYLSVCNQQRLPHLLESLILGETFTNLFKEELKIRRQQEGCEHKLVKAQEEKALAACFAPALDRSAKTDSGIRLNTTHLANIFAIYGLTQGSDLEKAQLLLSLAVVFTHYSSAAHFGTDMTSPDTLRFYAFALMHEAKRLDRKGLVLSNELFHTWSRRLLGKGDAFTCTSILSAEMVEHARAIFPKMINAVLPAAWS